MTETNFDMPDSFIKFANHGRDISFWLDGENVGGFTLPPDKVTRFIEAMVELKNSGHR
jgi:hypothetical protein